MDILEKTIEDIIISNINRITERGFPSLYENTERQCRLPSGRIMDIFSYEYTEGGIFSFKLIELKKGVICDADVAQACEYTCEVLSMVVPKEKVVNFKTIVIGSGLTDSASSLHELCCHLDIYLFNYEVNGIFFKKLVHSIDTLDEVEVNDAVFNKNEMSFIEKITKNKLK